MAALGRIVPRSCRPLDIPRRACNGRSSRARGTLQAPRARPPLRRGRAHVRRPVSGFTGLLSFGRCARSSPAGVYMTAIAADRRECGALADSRVSSCRRAVSRRSCSARRVSLRVGGIAFRDGDARIRTGGAGARGENVRVDRRRGGNGAERRPRAGRGVRRRPQHEEPLRLALGYAVLVFVVCGSRSTPAGHVCVRYERTSRASRCSVCSHPFKLIASCSLGSSVLGGVVGPPDRRGDAGGDDGELHARAAVMVASVTRTLRRDAAASSTCSSTQRLGPLGVELRRTSRTCPARSEPLFRWGRCSILLLLPVPRAREPASAAAGAAPSAGAAAQEAAA